MKAAQMGLTSKAMLRAIYSERYNNYRGILYLFPNKTDVTDFSKGRVDPLIDENPETIGRWIRDTDAANIKRVWNCFLYLRGMTSRVGLKSIPVDFIIFDELDEAPQNAVDMAMERMGYSVYQEVSKLSNPTLPDYGIDKAFQETDQRYWLLKCERCG
jgi:phage terminase large subunit GpA-like protein